MSRVFISYSHTDRAWLKRLQVHLHPLQRDGMIDLWDDTRIRAGSKWRDEIREAVASANVAVLLVSADFMASDFIDTEELPPLLANAESAGTRILPVIISPSLFLETPSLSRFQTVNSPDRPLAGLPKARREAELLQLARSILDVVKLGSAPETVPTIGAKPTIRVEATIRTEQSQTPDDIQPSTPGQLNTAALSSRERFSAQVDAIIAEEQDLNPFKKHGFEGYWVSAVHQSTFDPRRFTLAALRAATAAVDESNRGKPFLFFHHPKLSKVVDDSVRALVTRSEGRGDAYDFWMLRRSGLLVHKRLFREDGQREVDDEDRRIIDPFSIILYVTEAIDALIRLYGTLGASDEDITWNVSVLGVEGRRLKRTNRKHDSYFRDCIAGSRSITIEESHSIDEWRAGHGWFAMRVCRDIFSYFHWDSPADALVSDWVATLLDGRV